LRLAVAAEDDRDVVADGDLMQDAAQLFFAFDRLPVHLLDDVMLGQSGDPGGAVVVDLDDLGTAGLLELQQADTVFGNITESDSEEALSCWSPRRTASCA
jgi:hypothetical protein